MDEPGAETILIVDDREDDQYLLEKMLRRVGVQNLGGWLARLRKGKSWKTLQLKRQLPRGSEEKNKLLVAPGGFPASRRWQSYCCYGSSYSFKQRVIAPVNIESQRFQYLRYAVFAYLYCILTFLIAPSKNVKTLNR